MKRKVRPRTRSQQNPISADIMGETMSIGGEGKLEVAEHKIRLEWERTVSHQEGEEVPHPLFFFSFFFFSFLRYHRDRVSPLVFLIDAPLRSIPRCRSWRSGSGTISKSTSRFSRRPGTLCGGTTRSTRFMTL